MHAGESDWAVDTLDSELGEQEPAAPILTRDQLIHGHVNYVITRRHWRRLLSVALSILFFKLSFNARFRITIACFVLELGMKREA